MKLLHFLDETVFVDVSVHIGTFFYMNTYYLKQKTKKCLIHFGKKTQKTGLCVCLGPFLCEAFFFLYVKWIYD